VRFLVEYHQEAVLVWHFRSEVLMVEEVKRVQVVTVREESNLFAPF
jgi:hypothetical protein